MTITNIGIENILRLIGQISSVPNDLSVPYMAIGTGTSSISFSDTTLSGESYRKSAIAGYPQRSGTGELSFVFFIDDTDANTASYTNIALFDSASSGNMFLAHKFASTLSKQEDISLRITIKLTMSTGALTTDGRNLIADIIIGDSTDYLDNTNASILINNSGATRPGMDTGYPSFASGNNQTLTWLSLVSTTDITDDSLANQTFTAMDLYNKTTSGTQVTDVDVASTKIIASQNLGLQYVMKLVR